MRLEQLRAGHARPRRYRNRRIGEFLKKLEFTEGRATGISKIIAAVESNSSPPPEFVFDEDRFRGRQASDRRPHGSWIGRIYPSGKAQ